MSVTGWIIAIVAVAVAVGFRALYRSHQAWQARQSPIGAWAASTPDGEVTLIFEGGPHEGLYKQITATAEKPIREFGHWAQNKTVLQMLIMASDIPNNPRVGVNALYKFLMLTPTQISINGPERRFLRFTKAPHGTAIDFGSPAAA